MRTFRHAAALTNALISNNSWGNGDQDYDLEAANYDAATRDSLPFVTGSQPVLFVFAAGDSGTGADTIESPGTAKDVMTVGALQEFRFITNQVAVTNVVMMNGSPTNVVTTSEPWLGETSDSNAVWGSSSDGNVGIGTEGTFGRFKPDVVAPGTFVVSCRSEQWDTNAYYHPTNNTVYVFPDLIPTNSVSVSAFKFAVPNNTARVIFSVATNFSSPTNLPPIPFYLQTNSALPYGNIGSNFIIILPSPGTVNQDWSVEASNVTMSPLAYDLIVDVQTTNWMGNYYQVLQGMNDRLETSPYPDNWFYRYETGTSMSAPAISGFLALIQDYFTNQFNPTFIPSPALLKAMVINGARPTAGFNVQVNNSINLEGWGLPNMSNSVAVVGLTNIPLPGFVGTPGPSCSTFIRDQPSTQYTPKGGGTVIDGGGGGTTQYNRGLATGDSETFQVTLNTNSFGNYLPLHVTLASTDPPGDPAAALKLVNSLELVVTDLDNPSIVYYGNDIGSSGFNNIENASNAPIVDTINNIQNVNIFPFSTNAVPDADFSVTVIGNRVNVNAVSQDATKMTFRTSRWLFPPVTWMKSATPSTSVTDDGIVSNPTDDKT